MKSTNTIAQQERYTRKTMGGKEIRIDGQIWHKIQAYAIKRGMAFATPNAILRLMLGLEAAPGKRNQPTK
jgi:hypothetical protein